MLSIINKNHSSHGTQCKTIPDKKQLKTLMLDNICARQSRVKVIE